MTSRRLTRVQQDLLAMLWDGWAYDPTCNHIIWKRGEPSRHVAEITGASLARRGYLRTPTSLDRECGSHGWWVLTQEGAWVAMDITQRRKVAA